MVNGAPFSLQEGMHCRCGSAIWLLKRAYARKTESGRGNCTNAVDGELTGGACYLRSSSAWG